MLTTLGALLFSSIGFAADIYIINRCSVPVEIQSMNRDPARCTQGFLLKENNGTNHFINNVDCDYRLSARTTNVYSLQFTSKTTGITLRDDSQGRCIEKLKN